MTLLGNWAALDIETSGLNPGSDQIIELGFLRFENCKVVDRYQSLVHLEYPLPSAISKLTGITDQQLKKAPSLKEVIGRAQELAGLDLLAHNSEFERSFLETEFSKVQASRWGESQSRFNDSLFLFPLLDPRLSQLSLENIIRFYGVKEKEDHRALEDTLDMLRALIMAKMECFKYPHQAHILNQLVETHHLEQTWYGKFLQLNKDQVEELAQEIDFNYRSVTPLLAQEKVSQAERRSFPQEFNGESLTQYFENEQELRKISPHYQKRESQIKMAMRVGQALKNQKHALIQAPTGTGKTFAYLVPALSFAEKNQEQILIATGTKALQAQAMQKDIPEILATYGADKVPKVVKLIGSGNHWCELLYRNDQSEKLAQGSLFEESEFSQKFFTFYLDVIFNFHEEGIFYTREDFPTVLKSKIKDLNNSLRSMSVDFRSCINHRCPYKHRCSYHVGLKAAKESQIIIGNHSLMLQWPRAHERPLNIIVDEAHRLEGEATKALTLVLEQENFKSLLQQIKNTQGIGSLFYLLSKKKQEEATDLIEQLREEIHQWGEIAQEHWTVIEEQVGIWIKNSPRYTELYWNEREYPRDSPDLPPLTKSLVNRLSSLCETMGQIDEALQPHHYWMSLQDLNSEDEKMAFTRFENFYGQLSDNYQVLKLARDNHPDYVHSLNFHNEFGVQVSLAPLNIGKFLEQGLYKESHSVILTSATLCSQGSNDYKGIEWLSGQAYLAPEKRFKGALVLDPVFDYQNRSKIFLCTDTPKMSDLKFVPTILAEIMGVIREIQGKTLLLFSSRQRFDQAVEYLLREVNHEFQLFIQGMGKTVVDDFKRAQNAILVGMESFGEGIDIPGEGLQFLFIDKIPDLRQDLVIERRREVFEQEIGGEFREYFLAHRTNSLHQKLGRLLRTPKDYGAAIIVDSRAQNWKGRTLGDFFQLMGPYNVEKCALKDAVREVNEFLKNFQNS